MQDEYSQRSAIVLVKLVILQHLSDTHCRGDTYAMVSAFIVYLSKGRIIKSNVAFPYVQGFS